MTSPDDDDLWRVSTRSQISIEPSDPGLAKEAHRSVSAARSLGRSAAPIAALLVLGFAHVLPVLASGRVWARNDYGSSVVPAFATLTGHVPFAAPSWAPHVFGGAPLEVLAAMPRYPLNLFAYFLEPPQAAAVFVGLHLAIAAVAAWFFVRRVGGASRSAALFGAMVYAFTGALWLRGMHPDYLAVAAWMPAVLRAAWDLTTAESIVRRRASAALLAVFTGLTLLVGGGAPMVMLCVLAAFAVLWDGLDMRVAAGVPRRRALRDAAPWLAAGVGAGVLLGAPGLLPFVEVVLDGARRSLTVAESSAFALFPDGWGRLLVPELGAEWTWPDQVERWLYFGVLTLPLAVIGYRHDARGRKLALWALIALVAALGILGPIHWLLYYGMPGYSMLRAPSRWVIVAGLAVAALAARGLDAMLSDERARRSALIPWAAALLLLAAVAAFVSPDTRPVRVGAILLGINAVFAGLWFTAAFGLQTGDPRRRWLALGAIVLLSIDCAGIVMRTRADEHPAALAPPAVLAEATRAAGSSRVFHDDSAGPRPLDNGNRWGYRNARGYSQAVPASFSTLLDLGAPPQLRFTGWPERLDPRLLRLLGVGVYVGAADLPPPPGFSPRPFVVKDGLAAWRSLSTPFETAVVGEVLVAPTRELEATSVMSIDPRSIAVVSDEVGLPVRVPGRKPAPAGLATLERVEDGRTLRARVTADREALLVVGEGHHRRWRAYVDGKPAPLVRANAIWMGVRVPAGDSTVELVCGPAARPWMLLLGVAGVALTAWVSPVRRRVILRA